MRFAQKKLEASELVGVNGRVDATAWSLSSTISKSSSASDCDVWAAIEKFHQFGYLGASSAQMLPCSTTDTYSTPTQILRSTRSMISRYRLIPILKISDFHSQFRLSSILFLQPPYSLLDTLIQPVDNLYFWDFGYHFGSIVRYVCRVFQIESGTQISRRSSFPRCCWPPGIAATLWHHESSTQVLGMNFKAVLAASRIRNTSSSPHSWIPTSPLPYYALAH